MTFSSSSRDLFEVSFISHRGSSLPFHLLISLEAWVSLPVSAMSRIHLLRQAALLLILQLTHMYMYIHMPFYRFFTLPVAFSLARVLIHRLCLSTLRFFSVSLSLSLAPLLFLTVSLLLVLFSVSLRPTRARRWSLVGCRLFLSRAKSSLHSPLPLPSSAFRSGTLRMSAKISSSPLAFALDMSDRPKFVSKNTRITVRTGLSRVSFEKEVRDTYLVCE